MEIADVAIWIIMAIVWLVSSVAARLRQLKQNRPGTEEVPPPPGEAPQGEAAPARRGFEDVMREIARQMGAEVPDATSPPATPQPAAPQPAAPQPAAYGTVPPPPPPGTTIETAAPRALAGDRRTPTEHRRTLLEHRESAGEHRRTASEHQATMAEHRGTISEHRGTASEHRGTASEHRLTAFEHTPDEAMPGDLVGGRLPPPGTPIAPKKATRPAPILEELYSGSSRLARSIVVADILDNPVSMREPRR